MNLHAAVCLHHCDFDLARLLRTELAFHIMQVVSCLPKSLLLWYSQALWCLMQIASPQSQSDVRVNLGRSCADYEALDLQVLPPSNTTIEARIKH